MIRTRRILGFVGVAISVTGGIGVVATSSSNTVTVAGLAIIVGALACAAGLVLEVCRQNEEDPPCP